MDILYVDKKHIKFDSVIDIDPDKIIDLDNICEIKAKSGKELDFDKRKLGKKMDFTSIKQSMERKYKVNVLKAVLVLFPIWICKIENKKNSKKRELCIDGIFSNEIQATNQNVENPNNIFTPDMVGGVLRIPKVFLRKVFFEIFFEKSIFCFMFFNDYFSEN